MASEAEQRRKARLAAELRENLKRRKAQGRAREAGASEPEPVANRALQPGSETPDTSGA